MRVFPLMLVIVLNSLVIWVFIGGFLGLWIFPALLVNFLIIFCSLKGGKMRRKRRMIRMGRMRRNALVTQRTTRRLEPRDNYFMLKASTFSVWLPSVVGNITKFPKMFIISLVASMAAKVVTLTAAVVLAKAGLQDQIQPNHFLLTSRDNVIIKNETNMWRL